MEPDGAFPHMHTEWTYFCYETIGHSPEMPCSKPTTDNKVVHIVHRWRNANHTDVTGILISEIVNKFMDFHQTHPFFFMPFFKTATIARRYLCVPQQTCSRMEGSLIQPTPTKGSVWGCYKPLGANNVQNTRTDAVIWTWTELCRLRLALITRLNCSDCYRITSEALWRSTMYHTTFSQCLSNKYAWASNVAPRTPCKVNHNTTVLHVRTLFR